MRKVFDPDHKFTAKEVLDIIDSINDEDADVDGIRWDERFEKIVRAAATTDNGLWCYHGYDLKINPGASYTQIHAYHLVDENNELVSSVYGCKSRDEAREHGYARWGAFRKRLNHTNCRAIYAATELHPELNER